MKIVDIDGKRLPLDGQAFGELLVRGPAINSGYHKNPEANDKAFDEEGWFRTGDVATIDEDGFTATSIGSRTSSSPLASGSVPST